MPVITCFGETLWDVFPTREKIGGAPLNVALRLHALGAQVNLISRIGRDAHGAGIRKYLEEKGLPTSALQTDPDLPTGLVLVTLDEQGSATYSIEQPVAWDRIETRQADLESVEGSDALIFGSLVCREARSKRTLLALMQRAGMKIFDVNLRAPHYSLKTIVQLMEAADFVKLNDEELQEVTRELNIPSGPMEQQVVELARRTRTKDICVTRGKDGALLLHQNRIYTNKGYAVEVKDTVGAGDSFLATLVFGLLSGNDPQETLDMACAVGSLVASKDGANPELSMEDIRKMMR